MSPDAWLLPEGVGRILYYNPKLDPRTLALKMTESMRDACLDGRYDDGTVPQSGPLNDPEPTHAYNLISSLCSDGKHRPTLDIDVPRDEMSPKDVALVVALRFDCSASEVVVVPSTSHWHAYVPTVAFDTWDEYLPLLGGGDWLVDEKYILASQGRGQTLLRPPHITKESHLQHMETTCE